MAMSMYQPIDYSRFLNIDPRLLMQPQMAPTGPFGGPVALPQSMQMPTVPPQGLPPQAPLPFDLQVPGIWEGGQPVAGPPSQMALGTPPPQGSIGQMLANMGTPGMPTPEAASPGMSSPAGAAPPAAVKADSEAPAPPPNVDPSLWDKLMGDPDMRKTLLKVGLQMMQPIQPGQTPLGAGAAAVSGGVDYLSKIKEQRRVGGLEERKVAAGEVTAEAHKTAASREKETESDKAVKASQAREHGARAGLYERSAGRNAEKLPKTRAEFMQQANLLIAKSLPNFISAEDIVGAREQVKQMADELYGPQEGVADKKIQPAPQDPAQRMKGTVYKTPKGDLLWTGTGWQQPK